ncbi:MAG: potassium channel family protein [Corynebacterium sp.]|nr:potassium channel family protein [Corynebacterium sp.]
MAIRFSRREKEIAYLPAEYSDRTLLNVVQLPQGERVTPIRLILRRLLYAIILIAIVAVLVYFERDGYNIELTFIDAVYYASVSLSTTGYGDIVPVSQQARLINALIISPMRIIFLAILVGTTLAVLTRESRLIMRIQRWRKTLRKHNVVIGYGTKGRAAVATMLADGTPPKDIVVVDQNKAALDRASSDGLVCVQGSGTSSEVLRLAGVPKAKSVIVAPSADDTAVLVTLSVRELSPGAWIVASVRESENQHLLEQSGADSVVISSETAGRMLGMATATPSVVEVMEDMLSPGDGFSVAERPVGEDEVGANPRHLADIVLGLVRSGELYRIDSPEAEVVEPGDRLLYVRRVVGSQGS